MARPRFGKGPNQVAVARQSNSTEQFLDWQDCHLVVEGLINGGVAFQIEALCFQVRTLPKQNMELQRFGSLALHMRRACAVGSSNLILSHECQ